ncbi:MAG: SRPBCC family protein [Acidimicrobiales bacterium]
MSADDTKLEELVRWREGLVSGEIFVDPGIHRQETERVFPRAWSYLVHESQLRQAGDFVTTFIGADPVLVARQRDGSIAAMLNSCRHRGMAVCRADAGHTRAFTCPFHGWTYDEAGRLINVPNLENGYRGQLDTSAWGLTPVPRVESYKGLVFATFSPDAPSLVDYLGEMAWYLDCLVDRREGGSEVTGGVHKIRMHGNWKLIAEQFAGDNYHAGITHASAAGALADRPPAEESAPESPAARRAMQFTAAMARPGRQFSHRQGHGVAGFFTSDKALTGGLRQMARDQEVVADYYDATDAEVANRLGAERAKGPSGTAGLVFPTFIYLAGVFGASTIGVAHPVGPEHFELWRWCLVDAAAPPEVKAAMVRCHAVWPLGLADADDGENWSAVQAALQGPMARRQLFNYQMGLGLAGPDPVYPGTVSPEPIGEEPQRAFYRRWLEYMTTPDTWPAVAGE